MNTNQKNNIISLWRNPKSLNIENNNMFEIKFMILNQKEYFWD